MMGLVVWMMVAGMRYARRPDPDPARDLRRAGQSTAGGPHAAATSALGLSAWTYSGGC